MRRRGCSSTSHSRRREHGHPHLEPAFRGHALATGSTVGSAVAGRAARYSHRWRDSGRHRRAAAELVGRTCRRCVRGSDRAHPRDPARRPIPITIEAARKKYGANALALRRGETLYSKPLDRRALYQLKAKGRMSPDGTRRYLIPNPVTGTTPLTVPTDHYSGKTVMMKLPTGKDAGKPNAGGLKRKSIFASDSGGVGHRVARAFQLVTPFFPRKPTASRAEFGQRRRPKMQVRPSPAAPTATTLIEDIAIATMGRTGRSDCKRLPV
jgi:hypothetical protein